MNCTNCAREVTSRSGWHQVVGYDHDREQGGTNALALRKRTGKIVCDACMAERKAMIATGQPPPTPRFDLGDADVRAALRNILDKFYPDDERGTPNA